jgi:hypothetical protein
LAIKPHPTLGVYMEVDGSMGVAMLSITFFIKFITDYFERRDAFREEICRRIHDS